MSNEDQPALGPVPEALTKAARSGNIDDMEAHADAARHAIAGEPLPENAKVKFEKVVEHEVAAVRGALHQLEAKIAELRRQKA
ncbi:MAG: hypothetical protein M3N49_03135 [Candidatus Eremiobacteraeota bacterium]|nr:hypothetical protein [Candidatus Eremiobacteraeota bacterium]